MDLISTMSPKRVFYHVQHSGNGTSNASTCPNHNEVVHMARLLVTFDKRSKRGTLCTSRFKVSF